MIRKKSWKMGHRRAPSAFEKHLSNLITITLLIHTFKSKSHIMKKLYLYSPDHAHRRANTK